MELKLTEYKEQLKVVNFDELKNEVRERLVPYKNYIVTEDLLPQAKKDLAELNKTKKLLNDEKIRIKNEIFSQFELEIKELVSLIDETTREIKKQTDSYEEERKDSKRKEIQEVFDKYNTVGLDISKIWNEKWLNKGTSIKSIESDIEEQFKKIDSNISMIDKLNYTDEEKHTILVSYLFNLDLELSIKQFEDGKANYQKLLESQNKPSQAQKDNSSTITLDTPQTSTNEPKTSVKMYSSVIEFTSSVEEMKILKKFLEEHGIQHKVIKNMTLVEDK